MRLCNLESNYRSPRNFFWMLPFLKTALKGKSFKCLFHCNIPNHILVYLYIVFNNLSIYLRWTQRRHYTDYWPSFLCITHWHYKNSCKINGIAWQSNTELICALCLIYSILCTYVVLQYRQNCWDYILVLLFVEWIIVAVNPRKNPPLLKNIFCVLTCFFFTRFLSESLFTVNFALNPAFCSLKQLGFLE